MAVPRPHSGAYDQACLLHLLRSAAKARRSAILVELLTDFGFAVSKARHVGVRDLIEDYDRALGIDLPPDSRLALSQISAAMRLAAPSMRGDWRQLAGQLLARISANEGTPALAGFLAQVREWREVAWLEPLRPALRDRAGAARLIGPTTGQVVGLAPLGSAKCAALYQNGRLRIWDIESGAVTQTLVCDAAPAVAVAASPDGRLVAAGTGQGTVTVWDTDSGIVSCRFRAHRWEVSAVAFCPAGLLTGSGSGELTLWHPAPDPRRIESRAAHQGWVGALAVSGDGTVALSCSDDGTASAWQLPELREISRLPGDGSWANDVAMAADGQAAIGYEDGSVVLWDWATDLITRTLPGRAAWSGGVAFAAADTLVMSGDGDGTLRVWDRGRARLRSTVAGHTGPVNALVTFTAGVAMSGGQDGDILRWDAGGAEFAEDRPDEHGNCVSGLAVHPAGLRAISAGHDGQIGVWDVTSGRRLRVLGEHGWKCTSVAFTPSGQVAVSAGTDGFLRLWEWPSGRLKAVLRGHANSVNCVTVTPDGRQAVSGSEDRTIRAWDLRTGEEVRQYRGHEGGIRCVAVTGDRILSASVDGTLRIWATATGELLHTSRYGEVWVNGVAVTPDGRHALCAADSPGDSLTLIRIGTGELTGSWRGHTMSWQGETSWSYGVAVSAHGRRAVSTSGDGMVHVWRLGEAADSLSPVCEFATGEPVYSCAFTPDGATVLIGNQSGRVHIMRLREPS